MVMVAGVSWLLMTARVEARTVTGDAVMGIFGGDGVGVG